MEGRSIVPAFRNRALKRDQPLFFEHEGSRAVRDGKWKLVSLSGDSWELYDLEADPTEMHDLSRTMPGKTLVMARQWGAWARRCHVDATTDLLRH
jgi:arylsulfatase A-like enzyme